MKYIYIMWYTYTWLSMVFRGLGVQGYEVAGRAKRSRVYGSPGKYPIYMHRFPPQHHPHPLPLKQPLCRNIPHSLHTFNHLFSFTLFYCVMNSKIFTYSFFYCSLNLVKRSGDQISWQNFKFSVNGWGGGEALWIFYFNFVNWSYRANETGVVVV